MKKLYYWYAYILGWPLLAKLNYFLHRLSLRGIGLYNYQDMQISGEIWLIRNIVSNLGKDLIIFDVGANKGDYSKALLESNVSIKKIYAFEPHPETFKKLVNANSTSNDHIVRCIQAALSNRTGKVKIYDREDNPGSSHASLNSNIFTEIHNVSEVETIVESIKVDEFCSAESIGKIDFLKVDVEGAELEVLRGAAGLIGEKRIRTIQFEFTQLNSVVGIFFKEFWDILHPNYNIYRLLPHGLMPVVHYEPSTCELFGYQNYVAILRVAS
jgi:FkbM family methyltransferase